MTDKLFIESDVAKKLASYRLPRYEQLPNYPIIMSQLVVLLDDYLSIFLIPNEEKVLTQSMINSYVRKKIIAPPQNKTYDKIQIIHLLTIGILKQILSISEIGTLIKMQTQQYSIDIAYNYFCSEIEDALKITFGSRQLSDFQNEPTKITALTENIHSAVIAFANKIYVKQSVYFLEQN